MKRAILAAVSGPTSTLSSDRLPFGSLLQTEIQIHVFEYADSMNMSSNRLLQEGNNFVIRYLLWDTGVSISKSLNVWLSGFYLHEY